MDFKAIAQAFRAAIEEQKEENILPEQMQIFPKWACGWSASVLGAYLKAIGCESEYVCGNRRDSNGMIGPSHAWIEVEGVVIDITADQFEGEGMPPVYVGIKGEWHQKWQSITRKPSTLLEKIEYREERIVLSEILRRANLTPPNLA